MATKENGGLARRQQLRRRSLIIFISSVSFFLGSNAYRVLPNDTIVGPRANREPDPLDEFLTTMGVLASESDPLRRERMGQILSASTNLIDIHVGRRASLGDRSYRGVVAEFCPLNFAARGGSPAFEDVVEGSGCGRGGENVTRVDLAEAVRLAREFDGHNARRDYATSDVRVLDLKGAVFHEGRCGATLTANSLSALDPARNRVHDESRAPESAMRACGDSYSKCSPEAAANLMEDVIYMSSRSADPREENAFFVFRPESTLAMETFRTAFPTTPWVFLYREPIEAMMSRREEAASSPEPSRTGRELMEEEGWKTEDFRNEEMRAVRMGTFCLSALRNLADADGLGLAVKYSTDLVDDFANAIFPAHFHAPASREGKERIRSVYRERGYPGDGLRPGPREDDENRTASPEWVRVANSYFLTPSYERLEKSGYNIENCRSFRPRGYALRCKGPTK